MRRAAYRRRARARANTARGGSRRERNKGEKTTMQYDARRWAGVSRNRAIMRAVWRRCTRRTCPIMRFDRCFAASCRAARVRLCFFFLPLSLFFVFCPLLFVFAFRTLCDLVRQIVPTSVTCPRATKPPDAAHCAPSAQNIPPSILADYAPSFFLFFFPDVRRSVLFFLRASRASDDASGKQSKSARSIHERDGQDERRDGCRLSSRRHLTGLTFKANIISHTACASTWSAKSLRLRLNT